MDDDFLEPLSDVRAYLDVSVDDDNSEYTLAMLEDILHNLGARVDSRYNVNVTHLIWKDGKNEKILKKCMASENVNVVSPLWVLECQQANEQVEENAWRAETNIFKKETIPETSSKGKPANKPFSIPTRVPAVSKATLKKQVHVVSSEDDSDIVIEKNKRPIAKSSKAVPKTQKVKAGRSGDDFDINGIEKNDRPRSKASKAVSKKQNVTSSGKELDAELIGKHGQPSGVEDTDSWENSILPYQHSPPQHIVPDKLKQKDPPSSDKRKQRITPKSSGGQKRKPSPMNNEDIQPSSDSKKRTSISKKAQKSVDSESDPAQSSPQVSTKTDTSVSLSQLEDFACDAALDMAKNYPGFTITDTIDAEYVVVDKPARTIKVFYALAKGAWIISSQWIFDSISAGKWLDPTLFEFSNLPGKRSREANADPNFDGLFCGERVYVERAVEPKRSIIQELFLMSGAQIEPTEKTASVVISVSGRPGGISPKWLFDSLYEFEKLDAEHFLIEHEA